DALHLDDAEGVDYLPNEEIFIELDRMGYEKLTTKLTFYKAFFSSQWKFLIHTILQSMSAKRTSWNEFSSAMASVVICLSTGRKLNFSRVGKGCSGVETPLFEGMIAARELENQGNAEEQRDEEEQGTDNATAEEPVTAVDDVQSPPLQQQSPPSAQPQGAYFLMSLLQEALDAYVDLTRRVEHLEHDKRIESSDDTLIEDVSNQGREFNRAKDAVKETEEVRKYIADTQVEGKQADIYNIDMDHAAKVLSMQEDESEVQEAVEVVTTAKLIIEVIAAVSETVSVAAVIPSAVPETISDVAIPTVTALSIKVAAPVKTAVPSTIRKREVVIRDQEEESSAKTPTETTSKDKGKGILVEEPKPMKKKQQVELDEAYTRKLQEEFNQDIDWEAAIDHNTSGFTLDYFKGMSYDDIRLIFVAKFNANMEFLLKSKERIDEEESRAIVTINETPAQKAAKRRKLIEEAKEAESIKQHLQIVPDEDDDVFTEATPLARKVLVVDYQVILVNNKPRYKIIKADDTHQLVTITLSFKVVDPTLGNNKWYQSLLRGFDRKKNNSQVQQSLLSWPSQRIRPQLMKSRLWHRRLGHLNFKTMNKLVRHNLVKCLPSKCFKNDHTCVAFLKGKKHKASCKTKLVNYVSKPLYTLHMDLFGPTSVSSLNHKWYCLVVTDDFSRFTWTFFLKTKDETSGIFRNFITEIENLKDIKAEAVNTACYVQNRVLVNKSHKKTSYELFNSRTPAIGFLKPFGCHVMILNTLDYLGMFDAKGDEGYFIGYSMSSKAFRVFNKRTKKVEENQHVDFLKNKLIEKGAGLNWLFNIFTLTNSMNYVPVVVAGTSSTNIAGTKDIASQAIKKDWKLKSHSYFKNPPADQMDSLTVKSEIPTVSLPVPTACLDNSLETSSASRLISKGVTIDTNRVEADLSNMESIIPASPTPTFKIHKDHSKSQIIGHVDTLVQTRHKSNEMEEHSFIATIHQKANLNLLQNVWILVDCPKGLCREFKAQMHDKFQMSSMGELNFFLGLEVLQKKDAYSDSDYGGATQDRKSTTRGCQFLGRRLISWQCKKQTIVATSKTEAEYVATASGHGQVLWIQNQLMDYWYALTINPTVYVSQIRQFWSTARIETTNKGTKILATVDGKPMTIFESSIRSNLKLNDEEGISSLPDAELFENLALMGYNILPNQNFTFQKGQFSHQWKFLIHTIMQCLSPRNTGFNEFSSNIATAVGEGSGTPTEPHHTPSPQAQQSPHHDPSSPLHPTTTTKLIPTATPTEFPTLRDDSQGEAFPTVFGLDAGQDRENIIKTSALPYDSTPRVTSLDTDEGTQDLEISSLKARIKLLEDKDRGSAELSGDDAPIKGRSMEIEEEAGASGVAAVSVPPVAEVSTVGVPTVSGLVPTVSAIFTTASVVTPYSRRPREISTKDKGKEKMVESDMPKKKKLQEQIDVQVAREMEEEMAREDQRMNEQIHLHEYEQAAADLNIGEKIELINELEQREFYMSILRSHAGWKTKHFGGMTLEEIREKFIPIWKQLEDFVPMSSTEEGKRMKRKGLKLDEGSARKIKTSEDVFEENLKGIMQLVPVEEALVKETLSIKQASSDKEKELWVEMKRMFEPDFEDQLWTYT
nr:ribonuclease H-like domain-containing protein [Tanacetum cinerariifolium]